MEFSALLKSGSFPFVFISQPLYERNKAIISMHGGGSQIVLLVEFGESIPAGNWRVLSMPAHAISIANIFNGTADRFSYGTNKDLIVQFTAPDAKVLVVDDIDTNLKVVSGLLAPYGMEVDLCGGGAEAIKMVKTKRYDIVFMDHRMPGMDGVEATARIRALGGEYPYLEALTIVALTANAVVGMKEIFLQNGFDDFMSKPIDTVILNSILEKWIPKEKQTGVSFAQRSEDTGIEDPWLACIDIDGLDTNKGVRRTGGTAEYYYQTLNAFYGDGAKKIDDIKGSLDKGDMPLYTIHVHAVKSASANIGADKISEAAYALEMAGQQGDLAYIEANNGAFLSEMERLLGDIGLALSLRDANSVTLADPQEIERFNAELTRLKAALEAMDAGEINRSADMLLRSACDEDKATIRKISNYIVMFEYDEAAALIDSLLTE